MTIDRDLAFALPDGGALALPALAFIETKGAGKATMFDRLLWRCGYRPLSMSKFTLGLGLLRPDLPHNRWHRLRLRLLEVAEPSAAGAWPVVIKHKSPAPSPSQSRRSIGPS